MVTVFLHVESVTYKLIRSIFDLVNLYMLFKNIIVKKRRTYPSSLGSFSTKTNYYEQLDQSF